MYRVLARRYRPERFSDLIGQESMVKTLSNAMLAGRMHHAFVFTGTRGIGKTTTARIIAKSLNCSERNNIVDFATYPCLKCENCVAISSGSHPDVLEFDAASNTGIDDIKILLDSARYTPVQGLCKVFIIDEVHMLSTKAFNSILKTLEEPPEKVVFIFATTEIRKVPITILSRCQRFNLRSLKPEELSVHLKKIADLESIQTETEALDFIAQKADGSVRDALSLLDQAIVASQAESSGKITFAIAQKMLNVVSIEDAQSLLSLSFYGNVEAAISKVRTILQNG
jgi:DNA polymerase-3 subunit gamma/tau